MTAEEQTYGHDVFGVRRVSSRPYHFITYCAPEARASQWSCSLFFHHANGVQSDNALTFG